MIVVSNATPLINFASIEEIDLLGRIYERIVIPEAVYYEVYIASARRPEIDIETTRVRSWIETQQLADNILATALTADLGLGEAQAIALATEVNADLLLLDERKARRIATRLELRFTGTLGILIEAKRREVIPEIKPLLDGIINRAGFWITQQQYLRALSEVGE
ncbi:MAG: DUF3368 domain-containing protein [Chloroflexia bacterium]